MASRHIDFRADENYNEIESCLHQSEFDQEQLKKTLKVTQDEVVILLDDSWTLEKLRNEEK